MMLIYAIYADADADAAFDAVAAMLYADAMMPPPLRAPCLQRRAPRLMTAAALRPRATSAMPAKKDCYADAMF